MHTTFFPISFSLSLSPFLVFVFFRRRHRFCTLHWMYRVYRVSLYESLESCWKVNSPNHFWHRFIAQINQFSKRFFLLLCIKDSNCESCFFTSIFCIFFSDLSIRLWTEFSHSTFLFRIYLPYGSTQVNWFINLVWVYESHLEHLHAHT